MNSQQRCIYESWVWLGGAALALLTGCGLQQPTWQTYEEISTSATSTTAPSMPMGQTTETHDANAFQWTVPDGWKTEVSTGMRLATFVMERNGFTGTCTIIKLGGAAGGLEANVRRWLGQLNLQEPAGDEWTAFLDRQERMQSEGGFEGVLTDLTPLGGQAPETPSMLAGLFNANNATLFVKLTGSRSLLKDEKAAFTQLCRSLRSEP